MFMFRRLPASAQKEIFLENVDPDRKVRRLGIGAEGIVERGAAGVQRSLFDDEEAEGLEHARSTAVNDIKRRFGKNAILKGMDLLPAATARDRNTQIGGHRSGS